MARLLAGAKRFAPGDAAAAIAALSALASLEAADRPPLGDAALLFPASGVAGESLLGDVVQIAVEAARSHPGEAGVQASDEKKAMEKPKKAIVKPEKLS